MPEQRIPKPKIGCDTDAATRFHFSVVIPTYQRRELVTDTVSALARQSYDAPFEVIVVVDGATDGTAAALSALELPFPLRVIQQENAGLAAARNRGAARATGDILLFLDDDMIAKPDLLREHARSYEAGADAVAGGFAEDAGTFSAFHTPIADEEEEISSPFAVYGGHMSVRRSVFEEVGRFDPDFTRPENYGHEDSDLAHRLLQRFRVVGNPAAVCRHRKQVSTREYIARGRSSAAAEARLLEKHPELGEALADWSGASRLSRTMRAVSRLPVAPQMFAATVGLLANLALKARMPAGRRLRYLCGLAYTLTYWSAVQRQQKVRPR